MYEFCKYDTITIIDNDNKSLFVNFHKLIMIISITSFQSIVESMVGSAIDFTFEFAWIRDGNSRDEFLSLNQTTPALY